MKLKDMYPILFQMTRCHALGSCPYCDEDFY